MMWLRIKTNGGKPRLRLCKVIQRTQYGKPELVKPVFSKQLFWLNLTQQYNEQKINNANSTDNTL